MWRTKSLYTSEGWHRSIAGTLLLVLLASASASPPLRSASVSLPGLSRRDGSLSRGGVRFFPPGQGRRKEIWLGIAATERRAGSKLGAGTVGFRFGLCWRLVAAACLCLGARARAGVWGWLAGVVWVSARLKWGTSSRPATSGDPCPRIVAWVRAFGPGSGVKLRSWARTRQTERYALGLLELDPTGRVAILFHYFEPPLVLVVA